MSTRSRQASTWIFSSRASPASAAMSATLAVVRPLTPGASAAGPVHGMVRAEGVAGDHRGVAAGATRTGGRRRLLVVLLLDVDLPHVIGRTVDDVLDGEHRRVHGVVLVVVAVHAVAADRVNVRC